jgi:hypothetical protein
MDKLLVFVLIGLLAYGKIAIKGIKKKIFKFMFIFLFNSKIDCRAEGAFCGGIAGFQCCGNQHLKCQLDGNHPDAGGKCIKTCPRLGETCGGFFGIQCCAGEGLKCQLEAQCCDMPGKCVKAEA